MAEGTDVVLEGLATFYTDLTKAFGDVFGQMTDKSAASAAAQLGLSGVPGSAEARAAYQELAQSLQYFLRDVSLNAQSLTNTAAVVGFNYLNGDTSQQAQMASVDSALDPAEGTTSVASEAQRVAQEQRDAEAALSQLWLALGVQPGPVTSASGVVLSGDAASKTLAEQVAQSSASASCDVAAMNQAERARAVQAMIDSHHEDMRQASATRQVVGYDDYGNPIYDMVAPTSYREASGAAEENTNHESEYHQAQDWAAQEEKDGYDATVTITDDGEIEKTTTRPPDPSGYGYAYSSQYGSTD